LLAATPLGRFGSLRDAAAAVLYLCSPAAAMVTGHVLAVDGGFLAR
ncbi:short chain dehydrogenase, partial [Fuscovulum blasticum DSM 2131]